MMLLVLGEWWAALDGINKMFWGISIVFSVLSVIQFVLSLIGLDFETDMDEVDTGSSADADFTLLSVHSFITFFTFFGWAGVLVLNNNGTIFWAITLGVLSGFLAMLLVGYLLYSFARLQEDGSVDIYEAIDEVGTVYMKIPANQQGNGKIQIKLQGSIKEMEAMTRDGEQIPTGAPIRVVDILDDDILIVESLDKYLKSGI